MMEAEWEDCALTTAGDGRSLSAVQQKRRLVAPSARTEQVKPRRIHECCPNASTPVISPISIVSDLKHLQNNTCNPNYQEYSGNLSAFSFGFNPDKIEAFPYAYKSGRTRDPYYTFYSGDLAGFNFSSTTQPQPATISRSGASRNYLIDKMNIAQAIPYPPRTTNRLKRSSAMQDLYAASTPWLPLQNPPSLDERHLPSHRSPRGMMNKVALPAEYR